MYLVVALTYYTDVSDSSIQRLMDTNILNDEPETIEDEQHKDHALILTKKQRQRRLRAEAQEQTTVIKNLEEQA